MSLNPDLGHLYHDYSIWNDYTALDAREKLRTREINAREEKHLAKYSSIIDRAKGVCKQQYEREERQLRSQLETINARTPSLNRITSGHQTQNRKPSTRQNVPITAMTYTSRQGSQKPNSRVSSWSVYSHLSRSTQSSSTSAKTMSQESALSDRTQPLAEYLVATKCATFAKKADHVAKSLQRLYTKSKERKIQENTVTVLDVLGRESKHELETALFLLRGSEIGNVIEEILENREKVSKVTKTKSHEPDIDTTDRSDDSSGDASVSLSQVQVDELLPNEKEIEKDTIRNVSISDRSSRSPHEVFVNEQVNESNTNTLPHLNTTLATSHASDDVMVMSSTIANPSESDNTEYTMGSRRWTEIFRAPELWKLNKTMNRPGTRAKPISLVTLTGKQRHTLLK